MGLLDGPARRKLGLSLRSTMGIAIVEGRSFDTRDHANARR